MDEEQVFASAVLKSESGLSVCSNIRYLTAARIRDFRPNPKHIDMLAARLSKAGFSVLSKSQVGVSFSGHRKLFECEFNVTIRRRNVPIYPHRAKVDHISFFEASERKLMSDQYSDIVEAFLIETPAVLFQDSDPPTPNPPYYYINVLGDIPNLLNVTSLHQEGITGSGVRVSVIDDSFLILVDEEQPIVRQGEDTQLSVENNVMGVCGVWVRESDIASGRERAINYFTGGRFDENRITLGEDFPDYLETAKVAYWCLHPHYLNQHYRFGDISDGTDPIRGRYYRKPGGHGTSTVANLLAVAPGVTLSFISGTDAPVLSFRRAIEEQDPHIVSCSWGLNVVSYEALALEIANAVANGITVLFAAGNRGNADWPSGFSFNIAVSHPDILSIGGVYPVEYGGLRAANYAASYDSRIYTHPLRHVPDVCGLCGENPAGVLIMAPTQPGGWIEERFAEAPYPEGDNTGAMDGWKVTSGTSAAAPHVAGVAALLIQKHSGLSPASIKNVLENSARDVSIGSSSRHQARVGWDPATGFGLADGAAALTYLQEGRFNAYIRDSIEDNGQHPVVAYRLWTSPDIIVRNEMVDNYEYTLGDVVKYRGDLSEAVESGQDNYAYLRIQNRGNLSGNCSATLFFAPPGAFAHPARWTRINTIEIANLEPGEFRAVGPIVWPEMHVPATGHYCLIAVLDSDEDPAPDLAAIGSLREFEDLVRNKNNVAWRNLAVVDSIPGATSSFICHIDALRSYNLRRTDCEIDLTGYPPGGTVLVKVKASVLETTTLSGMEVVHESGTFSTLLHRGGNGVLEDVTVPDGETIRLKIFYSIPADVAPGEYQITITTKGVEADPEAGADVPVILGSYTQSLLVSASEFVGNLATKKAHRRDCALVADIAPAERVYFESLEAAVQQEYEPCVVCLR